MSDPAIEGEKMNVPDPKIQLIKSKQDEIVRPSREEAEEAVRTLLRWAGDDPRREGLLDTPKRVVKAYGEWFRGYSEDPAKILERTFEEVEGYGRVDGGSPRDGPGEPNGGCRSPNPCETRTRSGTWIRSGIRS